MIVQQHPKKTWLQDYFFIIMVAMLAYWPVSLMVFSLKNDAINYFLAMRYNISDALQHGYFPSWSAYINLGYPLHADMQSGVWNPLSFLLCLFGQYDIYRLHIETMLTIIIAGISMYHLLRYFRLERKVVLAISAAYMLNGYIADAGQFMNWLYAASLLPFVFLCTLRCFSSFKKKDAFLLGISYSLMMLCSYPADFILLSYIILFFVAFWFFNNLQKGNTVILLRKYAVQAGIAVITFLITCLPAILSFWPFLHSISRGSGVSTELALQNSLAPANLISLVTPWATMKGLAFMDTDPLIRNCYIGIIPFVFFVHFLFQKSEKQFIQKFLIWLFVIFLIFSLGKSGGLRLLSYHVLPLMNVFKHPANAKLFFIFAAQLLAAFSLDRYCRQPDIFNKILLKRIFLSLFLLVVAALIFGLAFSGFFNTARLSATGGGSSLAITLKKIKESLTFYDLLALNCLFLLPVTGIAFLLVKKNTLKNRFLLLVLADMIFVLQGMLPLTYAGTTKPRQVEQLINQQPTGYPLPDPGLSLAAYSADGMKYFSQIGCLNPYNKKPGRSTYIITPSNLIGQENFWNNSSFRDKIMEYPIAYFADTVYAGRDSAALVKNTSPKKVALADMPKRSYPYQAIDSQQIAVTTFHPGMAVFQAKNSQPALFVFQQNKYFNWSVYVNGYRNEILPVNISFMGVALPAGNNTVRFVYEIKYLEWIALASLLFVATGLFLTLRKHH